MTPKQIPESRIAINPVVIDDSKRSAPAIPNTCEYEKKWETHCVSNRSSDSRDFACYVSYSCALCWCKYPERKCEVKK